MRSYTLLVLVAALAQASGFVVGARPAGAQLRRAQAPPCSPPPPPIVMQKKSKKDVLELDGVVLESLPNATFRVQLDDTDQVRRSPQPRREHVHMRAATRAQLTQHRRSRERARARRIGVIPPPLAADNPGACVGEDPQELHQDFGGR